MPAFLIPARNSRHRTACLALYRALIQQALRVPLPDDLSTVFGPKNPIKHLVRRAFRRNRSDTSPRLIYPALKAGYQILGLLRSATLSTASSPNTDHASIISFLRERLAERNRSLTAKEIHPPYSRNPARKPKELRPTTTPLFVNVTPEPTRENPNPKPVYATPSRPRPLSELGGTGRRKVPKLGMASDFPLLRLTKPQPWLLNQVMTNKILNRVERSRSIEAFWEDTMPDAELEDKWEIEVSAALQQQLELNKGLRGGIRVGNRMTRGINEQEAISTELKAGNTFQKTIRRYGIDYVQTLLTNERSDQIARADAMRRLIEAETKLAKEEKAKRDVERRKRWADYFDTSNS
ncbi:hypothetical protein F4804DRAFT_344777 [Jackrogersella minutella]|nr:hypothetical protein F4804DRAFT_344777 [Jackrogersella minutella]